MRNVYLGIDTSNYTTSTAVLHETDKSVVQQKKLLPVKQGELGLRQSDAVFHHTQQIPDLLDALWKDDYVPKAVGVSVKPRDAEGSYMPCFSVGAGIARAVAKTHGIPLYSFSHQSGHIGAALYGAGRLDLLSHPLIAFHVSGGTTEAVLVRPDKERIFTAEIVSCSLDLKGGQAVDRVGVMLGLSFPAGKELEQLALQWEQPCKVKASVKGQDFSLLFRFYFGSFGLCFANVIADVRKIAVAVCRRRDVKQHHSSGADKQVRRLFCTAGIFCG